MNLVFIKYFLHNQKKEVIKVKIWICNTYLFVNKDLFFLHLQLNLFLMKEKATLKQIAKQLGVSVSTVSKALNDSPEISETTKTRI